MAGYKGDKIMRFEQAFYTRGPELLNTRDVGLGISASRGFVYKKMYEHWW